MYIHHHALNMINCYHIYLQVITLYDLILYDVSAIHPEIEQALRVKSRQRAIFWVNFPNPPKKYQSLWKTFIKDHIKPIWVETNVLWHTNSTATYHTTFSISCQSSPIHTRDKDPPNTKRYIP